MPLREVQAALARLFVDDALRAQFAEDPLAAARALGLDEDDAAMLAGGSKRGLQRFAGTLKAKRVLDAAKCLPQTAAVMGEEFSPRLRATFVDPPPGAKADCLALVASLARDPPLRPSWLADLARYEAAFLHAPSRAWTLRVRLFRYPVHRLAAGLRAGRKADDVRRGAFVGVWLRLPGRRLWHRFAGA